mgnify:FL=1
MKARLAIVAAAAAIAAAAPLASAAGWDLRVPSTFLSSPSGTAAEPLPAPGPVELLFEESVPLPAPQLTIPAGLPGLRPAPRTGKALFDANLALMVGLNVADYLSTVEALKYPGLTETNPIMAPLAKSPAAFAAVKLGTTALSYWSMKVLFRKNRTLAWIVSTVSNAALSYVVANNLRLIEAARTR